jgi:streptomycin 6-kinase
VKRLRTLKQNILDIYGNKGKEWLAQLPTLIAELANKHQLIDLQPVANMSFNYVASGFQNEKPIILKLGLDEKALANEADCLRALAQHGAAKVIAHEPDMILMQRANPGTTLKEYFPDNDKQAVSIVCQSMQLLHKAEIPKQHHFLPLNELLRTLDNDLDIPHPVLSKARPLRDDLLASTDKIVLLHGDLHHENILKHGDGWLVIDPKGFVGDPVFDLCAFIHNPIPALLEQDNPIEIIDHRIQACAAALGFSKQRIQTWLYVKSVLCWAWCLDDNMQATYFKQFISLLDEKGLLC